MKKENLNGIYQDFAEHLGIETTLLIHQYYRGLQVTFPQKLLSSEYVNDEILQKYDGTNVRQLARDYSCSERKVRNILREHKESK
ncbi:MAG: Mor transcription activator family protein [Clostridiales bacterium]|nr:Mor transcription activator family protein [Clostridiales bacterium]